MIVSVKPALMHHHSNKVANVVNPLGTVVTVQSDEDDSNNEKQMSIDDENVIIHENCDEALFRPVVAPKAIFYSGNNKTKTTSPPEHILTKSLEANTEVAVRILCKENNKEQQQKHSNERKSEKINKTASVKVRSREASPKIKTKQENICKISSSGNKTGKKVAKIDVQLETVVAEPPNSDTVEIKAPGE